MHTGVINDEIIGLNHRVLLGDLAESAQEHTIGLLHDVSLVDAGDLLTAFTEGQVKGKLKSVKKILKKTLTYLGNTLGFFTSNDFQGFNDAGDGLVLKGLVFTLSLFTNDDKVKVGMTSLQTFKGLDTANIGVTVKGDAELKIC